MLNPATLQDAIVDQLRAIPDLVAMVGDEGSIQAYDDESLVHGDPEISAADMMGVSVLVVWAGAEMPRQGETRGWTHRFRIFLRADSISSYYSLVQAIVDGVPAPPAGDGTCTFLDGVVHQDCDGIQDLEVAPERGEDGVGRLSISFSITER